MKKWLVDGAGSILWQHLFPQAELLPAAGWKGQRHCSLAANRLERSGKRQVERGGGGAALKSNGKFISLMSHIEHCRIV